MTTTETNVLAHYVPAGKDKKIRARAVGRIIVVRNHSTVTVSRSFLAWLFAAIRKFIVTVIFRMKWEEKVPNSVEFYVQSVEKLKWRNPWFVFPGRLTVDAPGGGDRWRRSGKERPHRLRFGGRRRRAKLLIVAWTINLAAQRWGGPSLGKLPPLEEVPPAWWEKPLRLLLALAGGPSPTDVVEIVGEVADMVDS